MITVDVCENQTYALLKWTILGTQSLDMLLFDENGFDPDKLDYQAAINDAVISAGSTFAGTMANRAVAKPPQENTPLGQEQGRVVVDDGDTDVAKPKPPDLEEQSSAPKSPEDIIRERAIAAGLDTEPHPSKYKQLSQKEMRAMQQKFNDRTMTQDEYKLWTWNKRMDSLRSSAVRGFWSDEKDRILSGTPTREWTPEQTESILNGTRAQADGETMQGHHAFSVSQYPQLAGNSEIIWPATRSEHFYEWHDGNWRNPTHGSRINPQ